MVRRALFILASTTLLIACSEKEPQTIPKVAPAMETQVIEQSVDKAQELDSLDPEPSDQVAEIDDSLSEEDMEQGSEESAIPKYIEETTELATDAVEAPSRMEQASKIVEDVDVVDSAGTQYTVRAGDTLGRIALSQGVTIDSIVRANNISNKNTIRVGQQLIIE